MTYSLFHKNTEVLKAEYDAENNKFKKVLEIVNASHIPTGVTTMPDKDIVQALNFWWQSRLIPKNRRDYKSPSLDFGQIFTASNGFNLSDHYWIKPETSDMTWEKGNFLSNSFNEDIGVYLISTDAQQPLNMKSNTPDLFSNGEQDKRWVIYKNKRLLLKYGRAPYYEQPFNEMLATEICRRLKIPHVIYNFCIKERKELHIYSSCPCFINEHTEFVPAGFMQFVTTKPKGTSVYKHLINCCKAAGMKNIKEIENRIAEMVLIDYITANTDRHFGNFGFMRNSETLEWEGFAPIFDTGNAMFYEEPTSDLRKSKSLMENVKSRTFNQKQEDQLKTFSSAILSLNLDFSQLSGIKDYYHNILKKNPKVDEERASLLSDLLEQRIKNAQRILFRKNATTTKFLKLIQNNDSQSSFRKKIADALKEISKAGPKEKDIVERYIRSLEPTDAADLQEKIMADLQHIK